MSLLHRVLIASVVLLAGAGCVPASSIKPVDSLAELGAGDVLIVGKIELDPPLAPDEQALREGYEEYRNAVMLITDDELRDAGDLAYGDLSSRMQVTFGEAFFVSHEAAPFHILKGWVVMNLEPGGSAPLYGIFRVDVRPDDKAIYIGTIRYHRDDFFGTEKVVIKDDYATAQAEFRRKFGDAVKLRKALVTPIIQQ
ncbi:MAG: hypothetical protein KY410_08325 [Proteobacteria bacterium]|nr:hypothetical protein [Pseudomonadota bacterium]